MSTDVDLCYQSHNIVPTIGRFITFLLSLKYCAQLGQLMNVNEYWHGEQLGMLNQFVIITLLSIF